MKTEIVGTTEGEKKESTETEIVKTTPDKLDKKRIKELAKLKDIPPEWIDEKGRVKIPREEYIQLLEYKKRRKKIRKFIRGFVFVAVFLATLVFAMIFFGKKNEEDMRKGKHRIEEIDDGATTTPEATINVENESDGSDIPIDEEISEDEETSEEDVVISTEIPEIEYKED